MPRILLIFTAIVLVLVVVSAMDYFNNKKKLTVRGKIWLRMALIFAVITAYLYWTG